MTETNFPTATSVPVKDKNYKNAIIGVLAAGLIAVSGYLAYSKNTDEKTIMQQESQIAAVSNEKSEIQANFDASLARLDSMQTVNSDMANELNLKNNEIAKVKSEIRNILKKKNATAVELNRAKKLIASLNDSIASMEKDIARLKQENQLLSNSNQLLSNNNAVLNQEKESLSKDLESTTALKKNLETKVDIASTLNASNIVITPIHVKNSGKEKVSTTAKRVDKFLVSFDVENRIIQPGTTNVYVVVLGPDGKAINTSHEKFTTRDAGEMAFTAKVPVDLETAKRKNVEFAFTPGNDFVKGSYTIQIYQNGFLIGQGIQELKKGGLFS